MQSSRKVYTSWNRTCYIRGCGAVDGDVTVTGDRISFHYFPKNLERREKWIAFCELEPDAVKALPKKASICSQHFRPDELKPKATSSGQYDGRNLRHKDTIPSVNPPTNQSSTSVQMRSVVRKCCVQNCLNNSDECSSEVTFHAFPALTPHSSPELIQKRQQWLDFAFGPGNHSTYRYSDSICSEHFSPKDFKLCMDNGERKLRRRAVPMMRSVIQQQLEAPEETKGKKGRRRSHKIPYPSFSAFPAQDEPNTMVGMAYNSFLESQDDGSSPEMSTMRNGSSSSRSRNKTRRKQSTSADDDVDESDEDIVEPLGNIPQIITEYSSGKLPSRKVYTSWNRTCYVRGCGAVDGDVTLTGDKISFHYFPKNAERRQKWFEFCELDGSAVQALPKKASICSQHFHPDELKPKATSSGEYDGRNLRHKDTVPSLNPPTDEVNDAVAHKSVQIRSAVRKCCILNCINNSEEASLDVTFHVFPALTKNSSQELIQKRQQWLDFAFGPGNHAAFRWTDSLCSAHFSRRDFKFCVDSGERKLKRRAVPSLRSTILEQLKVAEEIKDPTKRRKRQRNKLYSACSVEPSSMIEMGYNFPHLESQGHQSSARHSSSRNGSSSRNHSNEPESKNFHNADADSLPSDDESAQDNGNMQSSSQSSDTAKRKLEDDTEPQDGPSVRKRQTRKAHKNGTHAGTSKSIIADDGPSITQTAMYCCRNCRFQSDDKVAFVTHLSSLGHLMRGGGGSMRCSACEFSSHAPSKIEAHIDKCKGYSSGTPSYWYFESSLVTE